MKNEPTALEIYQKERIIALTNEVNRLNDELLAVQETLRKTALKITVSNPDFLLPIHDVDFEIVKPECDHIMKPCMAGGYKCINCGEFSY